MNALVNVYIPACCTLGWLVRRCAWECRERGTGNMAACCLRKCLLLLIALLGDKARTSEYVRSIGVALLSWTPWHDEVPAAAYVEEACEAQLSQLSSALKRNPHATGVADVSDMYVLLQRPQSDPHDAQHHPVSNDLLRTVLRNVTQFTERGPDVVSHVPWRSGKTCPATAAWPASMHVPHDPWSVNVDALQSCLLHTLSRVHRAEEPSDAVADLCDDFLVRSTMDMRQRHASALTLLTSGVEGTLVPSVTRGTKRQLSLRDRNDPPAHRRRTLPAAVRPAVGRGAGRVQEPSPSVDGGPRFVGIPTE